MRSPATVLRGSARDKDRAIPELALATVCIDETGTLDAMVNVSVAFPVPAALLAVRVTVEVPGEAGVPEINPLVVLTDKPAGSPAAPKLVGLLVAVI
jgi:hypothetical protein